MQNVGLEPTRLAAQEPKSCMSANSISSASALPSIRYRRIKINEKYLKIVLTKWLHGAMVNYTSNEPHNRAVLTDIGGATFE